MCFCSAATTASEVSSSQGFSGETPRLLYWSLITLEWSKASGKGRKLVLCCGAVLCMLAAASACAAVVACELLWCARRVFGGKRRGSLPAKCAGHVGPMSLRVGFPCTPTLRPQPITTRRLGSRPIAEALPSPHLSTPSVTPNRRFTAASEDSGKRSAGTGCRLWGMESKTCGAALRELVRRRRVFGRGVGIRGLPAVHLCERL
jgi:hypothetical protein